MGSSTTSRRRAAAEMRSALATAIAKGNMGDVKKLLGRNARRINDRQPSSGSTPLSDAALHGRLDVAKYLLERGAKVDATNRDGNTPLHVAAFLCRKEIVQLLLKQGASPLKKNTRGETAIDVVSSPWNPQLAGFYTGIGKSVGLKLDLKRIERERPRIARLLRDHAQSAKSPKK